jgi:hypothetical protein
VSDTTTPPQEVQDLAGVRAMLSKLLADGRGDEMVAMVVGLMEKLLTKNSQLEWRLQAALRQLYRKRSEKVSPEQLALFLSQLEDSEAAKANVEGEPGATAFEPVVGRGIELQHEAEGWLALPTAAVLLGPPVSLGGYAVRT